ncbi:concanavalin A-like lectin/glucanase domain-containing protein [Chlamydoabsidia padenii]|nr:concanavalin A-like lectin/glucanase domain-containing protein [Chlamydoabsidia padenii]
MNRLQFALVLALATSCSFVHSYPHARLPSFSVPPSRQLVGKGQCSNHNTDFITSSNGWMPINHDGNTYRFTKDGLQLELVGPDEYYRLTEDGTGNHLSRLPYNDKSAVGATFASDFYMLYGRVSATIKSSRVSGAITSFILLSDSGDEIDFEFFGGDSNHLQTNYYYGAEKVFVVNGVHHTIDGLNVMDEYHTYTIDWSPDRIQWLVDDYVIRVKEKSEACQHGGVCKYPSTPARIQYGLWDGSFDAGTAEWARGPIMWDKVTETPTATINRISVSCHPEYN